MPRDSETTAAAPDLPRRELPAHTRPGRLKPPLGRSILQEVAAVLQAGGEGAEKRLRQMADRFSADRLDALRARGYLLLLADLRQQGWALEPHDLEVWATAPAATVTGRDTAEEVKARVRAAHILAREAQLADPSVREFFRRVETPRVVRGKRVSIQDLIDDGHALSVGLNSAAALPPSQRLAALKKIISPYVQVATGEDLCGFTGLPLLDVWRYFRHTWSLEYRPTPGRTLFILIRNAARPNHPVMAIAALASALPQMRVREEWVGWTPHQVLRAARDAPASWPAQRKALLRAVAESRALVRSDDLLRRAGAKLKGEALERRLLELSMAAAATREAVLRDRQDRVERGEEVESLRNLPRAADGNVDWRACSETPLFIRKRAKSLADLLFAERTLATSPEDPALLDQWVAKHVPAQRAVAVALREIRKVALASRLLDLNVCGAAPPYRDLLGGKLAALCVASREVREAYRSRYSSQVSEIASQMAGRPVVREPELCVLTTTSLYGVAASQYNRLDVRVRDGGTEVRLRWQDVGLSQGYGTVHVSDEAIRALRSMSVKVRGNRNVNNVFGEGNSPRMRQLRESLEDLGIEADAILQHSQVRRVYCIELFDGARAALRLDAPAACAAPLFSAIADAWMERWIVSRVTNRDVLMRIAAAGSGTVRAELADPTPRLQQDLFARPPPRAPERPTTRWRTPMKIAPRIDLVQSLYRDASSCADHHDEKTIELLHVPTTVDDYIREAAVGGSVVFITGNPGDGKTHLIKRLDTHLTAAKVQVCLDANERPDDELLSLVKGALASKRGCVVAINEGILVKLIQAAGDAAWAAEAKRQLLNPLVYRPEAAGSRGTSTGGRSSDRVRVVDLNLRNNLDPEVVTGVLARQLSLIAPCSACPTVGCQGIENARRLSEPRVVERLTALLDAVARGGVHATMRDLHGFVAFMIFGGGDCRLEAQDGKEYPPYWTNAFRGGVGPLFDAVRDLDPKDHSSPLLDDELWRRADKSGHWTVQPHVDTSPVESDLASRREEFIARKRRALFEHERGDGLLGNAGTEEARFLRDLADGRKTSRDVIRLLNRFFDRDEARGEVLHLWVSHRYDARPNRYAASSASVAASQLEILVPELAPELKSAFGVHYADHVVLAMKARAATEGLRIDAALIEALLAAERGLPSMFRRGEPEARVAAFFDRLARRADTDDRAAVAEVRFVDMNTGQNFQLGVDVKARRYARS